MRDFIYFHRLVVLNSIDIEKFVGLKEDVLVELAHVKRLSYVFSYEPFVRVLKVEANAIALSGVKGAP